MLNQPMQPTQQSMSSILAQVATVVFVNQAMLGMTRTDREAGSIAERQHNAKNGIASVKVSRLAGAEDRIKEVRQKVTEARQVVFDHTTAWGDRRLLANVNIEKMLKAWLPVKTGFDQLVQKLADDAPVLVATAEQNLGSFKIEPPTVDEIRSAFSLELKMEAIPDASQFKSNLVDKQIEAELRRRFEADVSAAYQQAQQDALQRLAEPLTRFVERMDAFQERETLKSRGVDPGKGGYFKDSLIDGITHISDVFASFNLTGDPAIDKLAKQLDIFRGLDAKALRDSKDTRDQTQKKAKEILEQLGDWIR